jgi:hypothetical protein
MDRIGKIAITEEIFYWGASRGLPAYKRIPKKFKICDSEYIEAV